MPPQKTAGNPEKSLIAQGLDRVREGPGDAIDPAVARDARMAELDGSLAERPIEEIAGILSALPIADAKHLWTSIPEDRQDDILREITDELREQLTAEESAEVEESQINAFELIEGRLRQVTITGRPDLAAIRPIWVDLLNPSKAERAWIGEHYGVELPDPGDETDIEVSSRFQVYEGNDIHLHSNFLLDREGNSRSVPVACILHNGILFSLRNEELPVFRLQRRRSLMQPGLVSDCKDLLLDLYGADVEYSADSLEDVYAKLGEVGRKVLSERMTDEEAAAILADIAQEEDLNGRIRRNILDTHRALSFLIRCKIMSPGQIDDSKLILRDIESLNSHTAFLFDKINFLMDATIGFININQNRRVSQLTVFGVVFMPLNILAGIGGMSEFSMMTQGIPWPLSYSVFIVGMLLMGWTTYVALKHLENRKMRKAAKAAPTEHP